MYLGVMQPPAQIPPLPLASFTILFKSMILSLLPFPDLQTCADGDTYLDVPGTLRPGSDTR